MFILSALTVVLFLVKMAPSLVSGPLQLNPVQSADEAGIRPGDLLRQLEGLVLATDGSMADYCDILRSRNPEEHNELFGLAFEYR